MNNDHLHIPCLSPGNHRQGYSNDVPQTTKIIMSISFHSHDDDYEGDHENDATSSTNHGPISKVIPNPLTDTTTTTAERERSIINSDPNVANSDKRPEDSWNSNTLTLNSGFEPKENEKEKSFKRMSTSTQLALARQEGLGQDWEEIWEKEREAKWLDKVQVDLKGWRGGNGLVHFSLDLLPLYMSIIHGPARLDRSKRKRRRKGEEGGYGR
jgi:hypothetical protein